MKHHWEKHKYQPRRRAGGENLVEGCIKHHGRFAFLLAEKKGDLDVFLRGRGLDLAMDGDRVQAKVQVEPSGKIVG